MITSIVLTGMYNIGISSNNKIKTPDGIVVDIRDIPFIRYRFEYYTDREIEFILSNKRKFPCVHIVEITLDNNTFSTIESINSKDEMIAKLIYLDVDNNDVIKGLSKDKLDLVDRLMDYSFDRLSLRDKSDNLFPLAITKMKKQIKDITGLKEDSIGVCGGPCCFSDGNACLTAVKAREIMSVYSDRDDTVIPSSNHEGRLDMADQLESCVNKCGCIRYYVFNSDTEAPEVRSRGGKVKEVEVKVTGTDVTIKAEVKEKKAKKTKQVKLKGYSQIQW